MIEEPEGWWEATTTYNLDTQDARYTGDDEGPEEWDLGYFDPDPYQIVGKCYNCAGYVIRAEASSDPNLHKYCHESYRQYVMKDKWDYMEGPGWPPQDS